MSEPFIPPWGSLPGSALEAIFHHLGLVQLAQMRLMCRHWNATICDSPVLMKKFVPRLLWDSTSLPADYVAQEQMSGLMSGRYRRIDINVANTIRAVYGGPLWKKLAQTVQQLSVVGQLGTEFDAEDLLELLRMVPDLTRLELNMAFAVADFSEVDLSDLDDDYKFEQLETLKLFATDAEWIRVLSVICPKLKAFKYNGLLGFVEIFTEGQMKSLTVKDLMPLFVALGETLQKISLKSAGLDGSTLRLISSAGNSQLKRLTLDEHANCWGELKMVTTEDFIQLCAAFPMLESLKFMCGYVDSEVLQDLHTTLGQLRTFCIKLRVDEMREDFKDFLSNMPQLEYLGVTFATESSGYYDLDLEDVVCPNLKKLKLAEITFDNDGLDDFFQNSPNLNHVVLRNFDPRNKANLVHALSELKSVETLVLEENDSLFCGAGEDMFSKSDLQGVELASVRFLSSSSVTLAACCPNAESVFFSGVPAITDEDVVGTLRGMPKLRKLRIDPCAIEANQLTDAALDFLADEGRHLDELRLAPTKTSEAARDRLTEALRNVARLEIDE